METKTINILLVEDQKLMRIGLKSLLEEHSSIETIYEATTAKEAIEKYKLLKPDVVLMDIGLPDYNGIEATKKLIEYNQDCKVIILTSHLSEEEIFSSLHAGARAYVMKDVNTDVLEMIIKTVNDGAMWLDPKIVPILREKNSGVIPARKMSRATFRAQHANLTQREYEVLKLVVDGKSNQQIADTLTISEHTAKAHVCNIIQKLVVDDRTQAGFEGGFSLVISVNIF